MKSEELIFIVVYNEHALSLSKDWSWWSLWSKGSRYQLCLTRGYSSSTGYRTILQYKNRGNADECRRSDLIEAIEFG